LDFGKLWGDEDSVRRGLLALIERAPTGVLSHVGAGPLEDFTGPNESRLKWVENQADGSPRFRQALANVWTWGTDPDEVAARLERAARVRLARPKDWTAP
jgi:hypothetical protein